MGFQIASVNSVPYVTTPLLNHDFQVALSVKPVAPVVVNILQQVLEGRKEVSKKLLYRLINISRILMSLAAVYQGGKLGSAFQG